MPDAIIWEWTKSKLWEENVKLGYRQLLWNCLILVGNTAYSDHLVGGIGCLEPLPAATD
jgi:hypothetical protein